MLLAPIPAEFVLLISGTQMLLMRRCFLESLPLPPPAEDQPTSKVPPIPFPWHVPQLSYLYFSWKLGAPPGSVAQHACERVSVDWWGRGRLFVFGIAPSQSSAGACRVQRPVPGAGDTPQAHTCHLPPPSPPGCLSPSLSPCFCFSLLCRWQKAEGCLCLPCRRESAWAALPGARASPGGVKRWPR